MHEQNETADGSKSSSEPPPANQQKFFRPPVWPEQELESLPKPMPEGSTHPRPEHSSEAAKAGAEKLNDIGKAPIADDQRQAPMREPPKGASEKCGAGRSAPAAATASEPAQEQRRPMPGDKLSLNVLRELVGEGRSEFLPQFREALTGIPHALSLMGDLSRIAEHHWTALAAEHGPAEAEAVRLKLQELEAKLVQGRADPLEQLVVEKAKIWWLQSACADILAADDAPSGKAVLLRAKLQDSALRNFLRTIRELAHLRMLRSREEGKAKAPRDAARAQSPATASPAAGAPTKPEVGNHGAGASEPVRGDGGDGAGS